MKKQIKRKSTYWKAKLLGKALLKILMMIATVGYIWLGLSLFILMNTR